MNPQPPAEQPPTPAELLREHETAGHPIYNQPGPSGWVRGCQIPGCPWFERGGS